MTACLNQPKPMIDRTGTAVQTRLSGRLKKRDRLVHVAWLERGFVGQRIIATLIDGAPRAATETSIGAFLLEILRFHFLHLLQELLQHLPRLRPSRALQPIAPVMWGWSQLLSCHQQANNSCASDMLLPLERIGDALTLP